LDQRNTKVASGPASNLQKNPDEWVGRRADDRRTGVERM